MGGGGGGRSRRRRRGRRREGWIVHDDLEFNFVNFAVEKGDSRGEGRVRKGKQRLGVGLLVVAIGHVTPIAPIS
jgi:hypothetical protein